jgi:signal peptidase II
MNMKAFVRRDRFSFRLITLLVIVVLVGVDRLTKWLVTVNMELGDTAPVIKIGSFELFNFTYIHNYGAAFGVLQGQRIFLTITVSLFIIAVLLFLLSGRIKDRLLMCAMVLIIAGGAGNLYDRVFYGYVVDFLDARGLMFPWIFNFADICATTGAFLGLFAVLREEYRTAKFKKTVGNSVPDDLSENNENE